MFGNPGFVYMITCEQFTKVGVSIRPQKRHAAIGAENPFPAYLVHTMATKHMVRSEKYLHKMLKAYHVKNE